MLWFVGGGGGEMSSPTFCQTYIGIVIIIIVIIISVESASLALINSLVP